MTGRATTARDDRSVPGLSPGRIAWMVLRVMASVAALLALYYALPLDRTSTRFAVTILVAGLVAFVVLVGLQIRTIIRSPIPVVRAVEALALSVPFFLLLFAAAYVVLAALSLPTSQGPCRTPTACTSPSPCSPPSASATSPPSPRPRGWWSPGRWSPT